MPTIRASCLCGDVAWEGGGTFELLIHCHCARCRKSHGSAFSTAVMCTADAFRHLQGRERIVRYESVPGLFRPFCGRCGSKVPGGDVWNERVTMPAGPLEGDPETEPLAHFFVASKAPWHEITDSLARFDTFAPGLDFKVFGDLEPRDPPGRGVRGSCLCGAARYVVEGEVARCHNCHCARCRKAKSAAYASNLFTAMDGVRFTRGEELLASFELPDARFFTQVFCRVCGSPMPRFDRERKLAIVPMGSLDDDPGIRPNRHIFVGSKAPWFVISDDLPQYAELPPTS
jgi:hypothetical protein